MDIAIKDILQKNNNNKGTPQNVKYKPEMLF